MTAKQADEIVALRQRVAQLESCLAIMGAKMEANGDLIVDNRKRAKLEAQIEQAARVEGLREAMRLAQGEQYAFEVVTKIAAEIAALAPPTDNTDTREQQRLERGDSEEEKVSEIPQNCDVCGDEGGYSTLVCGSCFNEMQAALERGKGVISD